MLFFKQTLTTKAVYPYLFGAVLFCLPACHTPEGTDKDNTRTDKVLTFHDQLYSVAAVPPDRVWIVGDFGVILHSTSGGKNWLQQDSGTPKALMDVDFVDAARGWLVGEGGLIRCTPDGGTHWQPQKSGSNRRLMSVDFVNPRLGIAAGEYGTILRTDDGGRTWEDRSLGQDIVLNKVFFTSQTHGWIVGEFGTILKTTDSGLTWHFQNSGINATSLFGVGFENDRLGWAVGQDGIILVTRNGGDDWKPWKERFNKSLFDIAVNREMGYIVGTDGLVLEKKAADWQISDRIISFSWLRAIALTGKTGGMVGDMGMVLRTSDGGESWQFVTIK